MLLADYYWSCVRSFNSALIIGRRVVRTISESLCSKPEKVVIVMTTESKSDYRHCRPQEIKKTSTLSNVKWLGGFSVYYRPSPAVGCENSSEEPVPAQTLKRRNGRLGRLLLYVLQSLRSYKKKIMATGLTI